MGKMQTLWAQLYAFETVYETFMKECMFFCHFRFLAFIVSDQCSPFVFEEIHIEFCGLNY